MLSKFIDEKNKLINDFSETLKTIVENNNKDFEAMNKKLYIEKNLHITDLNN